MQSRLGIAMMTGEFLRLLRCNVPSVVRTYFNLMGPVGAIYDITLIESENRDFSRLCLMTW